MKIAVIGAGLAGLYTARELARKHDVTVFEKARGPGGRMASRRTDDFGRFDHGCQYFTVKSPEFADFVAQLERQGVVSKWNPRMPQPESTQKYVAVPAMNNICKYLAQGLDIRYATRPESLQDLAEFDYVVSSMPPRQAQAFFGSEVGFAHELTQVEMLPCFTIMASFVQNVKPSFDALRGRGAIAWIALNNSKPERDYPTYNYTIHAGNDWSLEHVDTPQEQVRDALMAEFAKITGTTDRPVHLASHRWLYALAKSPAFINGINGGKGFLQDKRAAQIGDWLQEPRLEGAFLSAHKFVNYFANQFNR